MSVQDNFDLETWSSSAEPAKHPSAESQPEAEVEPTLEEINQSVSGLPSAKTHSRLDDPESQDNAKPSFLTELRNLLCEGFDDTYTWGGSGSTGEQSGPLW